MSVIIYNAFNRPPRHVTPVGNPVKQDYELKIEPDGRRYLIKTGETNIYDVIQSFSAESDLHLIVKRYEAGDTSVLQRAQGVYADITNLPADMHAAKDAVRYAERMYGKLPADVRAKLGGFDAFVNAFGTLDSMNKFFADYFPKVKKEGDKDEN